MVRAEDPRYFDGIITVAIVRITCLLLRDSLFAYYHVKSNRCHWTEEAAQNQVMPFHFMTLQLQLPSEGLPLLTDWLRVGQDLWHGYESWREPIEIRAIELGVQQRPRILVPVKGVNRASMICFAVVYSFLELKDKMNDDQLIDFRRRDPLAN